MKTKCGCTSSTYTERKRREESRNTCPKCACHTRRHQGPPFEKEEEENNDDDESLISTRVCFLVRLYVRGIVHNISLVR